MSEAPPSIGSQPAFKPEIVNQYGSWESPLKAQHLAASKKRIQTAVIASGAVWWQETRPQEAGRGVIVKCTPGAEPRTITPTSFSVKTRINEYGGVAFTVARFAVYFVNAHDQQIYEQSIGLVDSGEGHIPRKITNKANSVFGDLIYYADYHCLIGVEESNNSGESIHRLVAIEIETGAVTTLRSGNDFYSSPKINEKGQLVWLEWSHPNMPWDCTELWRGRLDKEKTSQKLLLEASERINEEENDSLFQPEWDSANRLWYVSDHSGYWNLYSNNKDNPVRLVSERAEHAMPQWVCGMRTYGFVGKDNLVLAACRDGVWSVRLINTRNKATTIFPLPLTYVQSVCTEKERAVIVGGNSTSSLGIYLWNTQSNEVSTLFHADDGVLGKDWISHPKLISWNSEGDTIGGFYYAPKNPNVKVNKRVKPPLIVMSHGGPTACTSNNLNFLVQFWTTRGFAVLDVNYRGSTGFGRSYRKKLDGQWGVSDVDDCVSGALHLCDEGLADRDKLIIRGSSAGGYTTLCCLTFEEVFKAGAVYYGIGDLEQLVKTTHKFEKCYLESLVAPYAEKKNLYEARSPANYVDELDCPVIFFHGAEDKVVPVEQSKLMANALDEKQSPYGLVIYPDEGHGFRVAENIEHSLQAELLFYGKVFDFVPADIDSLPYLDIKHLGDNTDESLLG